MKMTTETAEISDSTNSGADYGDEGNSIKKESSILDQGEPSADDALKKKWLFDCGTRDSLTSILNDIDNSVRDKLSIEHKVLREEIQKNSDADSEELSKPTESSNIALNDKNIWIVTTASLPWRTGTAINPLLRALYLVKRRLESVTEETILKKEKAENYTENKEGKASGTVGKVTLVIPWLTSPQDRKKLYGSIIDKNGEDGMVQQMKWIRDYCSQKCDLKRESEHLNIMFYEAAYWPAFGSIFPTVDICSLIPDEEADVAILEEPEHLNWFRMPSSSPVYSISAVSTPSAGRSRCTSPSRTPIESHQNFEDVDTDVSFEDEAFEEKSSAIQQKQELGWSHKFNFVVGIIHTNYTAYMKQYGIGTSIIAAPAIIAISKLVVRAYCHKVIRLSDVLPNYAEWKEVTSNVHGVRGDFLRKKTIGSNNSTSKEACGDISNDYPQIYFIGKLLWAKGFDQLLKVQEIYRTVTGENYFPIDIYGEGPDEKVIKRAFHGRIKPIAPKGDENGDDKISARSHHVGTNEDASSNVFSNPESLRKQLYDIQKKQQNEQTSQPYHDARYYIDMGFEVMAPDTADDTHGSSGGVAYVMERNQSCDSKGPVSIISDVSEKSIGTGIATSKAVRYLADSAIKVGKMMAFVQENQSATGQKDLIEKPSYVFDPPKTLFEWRRHPIPAQFLGVKDHALLRDMPYKIFLNTSVTEVLCTTTAEALAMGKFVIIPHHPSNTFFLQFPNCLTYNSLHECVEKIQWALANEPQQLTEELAYIFTWEAAVDRLIEASAITKRQEAEWRDAGLNKSDARMAWLHSDGGKKARLIENLFRKEAVTTSINHKKR